MQRPVMNPSFFDDQPAGRMRRTRFAALRRALQLTGRILLARPMAWLLGPRANIEDGTPASRIVRSIVYRLAFLPLLVVTMVAVLVYAGTHPPRAEVQLNPSSMRIYFDPVSFTTEDGKRIEAWLVPALSADRILTDREQALRKKHPAVVLVHGYGESKQEMLPLVRPLHDAGYVVFIPSLRGSGTSDPSPHTFGARESRDVKAAVELLRARAYVDADRVAVIGVGSGATAALLAAKEIHIGALVLQEPLHTFDDAVLAHLGPKQDWMRWIDPLCKWTFEIAYRVNTDDLRFDQLSKALDERPMLLTHTLPYRKSIDARNFPAIVGFLDEQLRPSDAVFAGVDE